MADAAKNTKSRNRKKSAIKATRVAARRRVQNLRRSKAVKDSVKQFLKTIVAKGDAAALLPKAYQAIDKAVKTGVLNKNTAARAKSALAKKLAAKS
jgi:small subunit ribosomal protein S20